MKMMIAFNTSRTRIAVFDMEQSPFGNEKLFAVYSKAICNGKRNIRYCNLVQLHSIIKTYANNVVHEDQDKVWKLQYELLKEINKWDTTLQL